MLAPRKTRFAPIALAANEKPPISLHSRSPYHLEQLYIRIWYFEAMSLEPFV